MKRLTVLAAMFAALVFASVALAAGGGYGSQPGYDNATTNSNGCAYAGAFGAFDDPTLHGSPGQPPYFGDDLLGSARAGVTGYYASGICGNSQKP